MVSPGYTTPAKLSNMSLTSCIIIKRREQHQPNFDICVRPERFQDVLCRNSHETQAMQNGLIKPADSGKLGKDLEVLHELLCALSISRYLHVEGWHHHSSCAQVHSLVWYRFNTCDETYRYRAACEGLVFSSSTASGALLGGVFAAEAAPRSVEKRPLVTR